MGWNDHIDLSPLLFFEIDDKQVCVDCVEDEGLKIYLTTRCPHSTRTCSYCGKNRQSTAVDDLQRYVRSFFPYVPVAEVSPRNDGEWLVPGKPSDEWIESLLWGKVCDDLYEDLLQESVDEDYCEPDWSSQPLDAQWKGQWEEFRHFVVRTDSGFALNVTRPEEDRNHDEPHPAFFYNAIAAVLLRSDAISVLPTGTPIQRVQWNHVERTFERLTCPPSEFAGKNRFSPKGVSMFYGATDFKTACVEIKAEPGDKVTLGVFETTRDLAVIDFTSTQFPKGDFDPAWMGNYHIAAFLKGFLGDIRKDVKGEEATSEYLPTQALCHFFKNGGAAELTAVNSHDPNPSPAMQAIAANKQIDGIRFHSSKVDGADSDCLVLFCDHAQSAKILELVEHDHLVFR